MKSISEILDHKDHRPFPYPDAAYKVYQEWHEAIFLHWELPVAVLQGMLPGGLEVDTLKGKAYISLVAFKAENSRIKYLPSLPIISDFLEANVRTYVIKDGIPGIYFLSMKANKTISAFMFRSITGFPYYPSQMHHDNQSFSSYQQQSKDYFDFSYKVGPLLSDKSELDRWLTERYCVYLDKYNKFLRFNVHHEEWPMQQLAIRDLRIRYQLEGYTLNNPQPVLAHYSPGVEVVGWLPEFLDI
ncbi:YqjF family protein [Anditalea andensis]|uniref:DUF2071 domain-containing protein n=1 Tax=Anditalea andensis TaxID=1048983 RepID=A0A074KZU4_9BACT|nr:DUF2071 domain-containing protein [Anditalea andensis]KEO75516.1 hypothetical protein EL17_01320 [Anditalea andensis]